MNGNKNFLLDTNIVLYLLSGERTLADILFEKRIYISVITEIELFSFKKLSRSEKQNIDLFLHETIIVDVDSNVKQAIVEIRKSYGLKLPDSIIAGTSLSIQVPLISADKSFKKIDAIELLYFEK